jgi:hypothetical protein
MDDVLMCREKNPVPGLPCGFGFYSVIWIPILITGL